MISEEHLYRMALTSIPGIGLTSARRMLSATNSATWLFKNRKEAQEVLTGIPGKIIANLDCPDILRRCEAELEFAEKNNIACLIDTDEAFPSRLRECEDAPLVLFYKGNADLNRLHVVSIVGTRHATDYGRDLCAAMMRDLKSFAPDILIVSGLAYGIDIAAHRASLSNGMDTVGVLAHGLDRIYPYVHKSVAAEMLNHGGLLTEFPSGTNPDRQNFIMRNRIIAGVSDATIVVQSARKGGALITASIASSYNRDCFAFPGRVGDVYSEGCNEIIRRNQAAMIRCAEDLLEAMNWTADTRTQKKQPIQRQLFPDLSEDEGGVVKVMEKYPDGIQINKLTIEANLPINKLSSILFSLEMKGVVKASAGAVYRLLSL